MGRSIVALFFGRESIGYWLVVVQFIDSQASSKQRIRMPGRGHKSIIAAANVYIGGILPVLLVGILEGTARRNKAAHHPWLCWHAAMYVLYVGKGRTMRHAQRNPSRRMCIGDKRCAFARSGACYDRGQPARLLTHSGAA
jgi:hypothetical protein